MKKILLTQNKYTIVSDVDYNLLMQWKWHFKVERDGSGYAARTKNFQKPDGGISAKTIRMHNFIIGKTGIDHIDGNKLNNQRNNLRLATKSQNGINRGVQKNSSSGYKGVCFNSKNKSWESRIYIYKKCVYLGSSLNKEQAAIKYNEAAMYFYGGFAKLNIVE